MARDFQIAGEVLVLVKGTNALGLPGTPEFAGLWELGLADKQIRITPRWRHRDLHADDYGTDVPPEVMWMLAEVRIHMTLIHYDDEVLDACIAESMGGGFPDAKDPDTFHVGTLQPAGTLLGGLNAQGTAGCHFISLNLATDDDVPWHFPTAHLMAPPLEIPVGTGCSVVTLEWRAIPYTVPAPGHILRNGVLVATPGELVSNGVVLWDRTLDHGPALNAPGRNAEPDEE